MRRLLKGPIKADMCKMRLSRLGGIAVEYRTAKDWELAGHLPKGTADRAKRVEFLKRFLQMLNPNIGRRSIYA